MIWFWFIRLRMAKSSHLGIRGQAAALDLAVFVAICILALSFLFIQSARSAGSTGFVEENENINEVAIKAVRALAQSSCQVEIKTLQTAALREVKSCFSDDIRKIMSYSDRILDILAEMEKKVQKEGVYDIIDDPSVIYLSARIDDILSYVSDSQGLLKAADKLLSNADSELGTVCDVIEGLSQLFPGYNDLEISCGGMISDLLQNISKSFSDTGKSILDLKSAITDSLGSIEGNLRDELADAIREIRCSVTKSKELSNQFLGYLETGIDTRVSFMELLPVEANVDRMTVEKLLSDAITARNNFVFAEDIRSVAGASALMFIRDKDLGENLPEIGLRNSKETANSLIGRYEMVRLIPKEPLTSVTNSSAKGPYHEFVFTPQAYVTPTGNLALRLVVSGGGIGGAKQKTEYFQSFGYIVNSSAYPSSPHYRTYNGSFVKGKAMESPVSMTSREWTEDANPTADIDGTMRVKEQKILRPMETNLNFIYGNLTWPEEAYEFDIEHSCVTTESNYTINTSTTDCGQYNESDAEKSILLGILTAGRGDLVQTAKKAVEDRLGELVRGYHYKFEVRDCCSTLFEINPDLEPAGREGTVKYYFEADGERAEMRLTVWR